MPFEHDAGVVLGSGVSLLCCLLLLRGLCLLGCWTMQQKQIKLHCRLPAFLVIFVVACRWSCWCRHGQCRQSWLGRVAQARLLMALHSPQLHSRSQWQGTAAHLWVLVLVLQLTLPQQLSSSSSSSSSHHPCQGTLWARLTPMLRQLDLLNMGLGCAGQPHHQLLLVGSALQPATQMPGTAAHRQLQRRTPSRLAPEVGRACRGRQLGLLCWPSRLCRHSVARLVRQRLWWGQLPAETHSSHGQHAPLAARMGPASRQGQAAWGT